VNKKIRKKENYTWLSPKEDASWPYTIIRILIGRSHSKIMPNFQLTEITSNGK
jgi:hypothetical protein